MPDKYYVKGCGPSCIRCWENRLKHANPEVKKYMKKHKMDSISDTPKKFNYNFISRINL
jgi:hypothetical protein